MYPKGLKISIILNLLLILAAAMLLVDLVMVGAARQQLLKVRLETGNSLLAVSGPVLIAGLSDSGLSPAQLTMTMDESSANCLVVINSGGDNVFSAGPDCDSIEILARDARQSIESGKSSSSFAGTTRGILWPDRKNMLVSRPIIAAGKVVGAIAVALDLDNIYQSLRNSQRMFFVYFIFNLLALVMLGFYQLYRRLLKPINRLVNTAEEFRDDDEFTFLPETKDGEFNRLSLTLNKMLARINRDRSRLQETIADLKEANLKLRKTQQEMIRSEKLASVGRLSAGIAHEIGNPIGIIIGYLDLLQKASVSDEQKKDFIVRAEIEVHRINTIIRQLLDFARQPPDEQQCAVSVHEAIKEVVEICTVQPMMAGITIASEYAAKDNFVVGTSSQLNQVFLNLLMNAADAIKSASDDCQEEGIITIRTVNLKKDRAEFIQIQFIDNGPGIASGNLENIFDPFYTTKEPGEGTGLGLSICFTIVDNMAGRVKASSDSEGTTITITLPLSAMPENTKR
ncbi:MAG: HAMP domain-containing histidine kinase [Desulfobulbaceae bacterium]|nr:HAMP domain-containing histidine kinase [Desulfobulbaceae bacterium]